MDPDALYSVRSLFYLGHFKLALSESNSVPRSLNSESKLELQTFLLRSQIGLSNYSAVLQSVSPTESEPALLSIRLLAQYLSNPLDEANTSEIAASLSSLLSNNNSSNPTLQLVASQIYLKMNNTSAALQQVHLRATMEHLAQCAEIHLNMGRRDLAKEDLSVMQRGADDAILTQLVNVWVSIKGGAGECENAVYILNMLSEQYGPSVSLLNSLAVAKMGEGDWAGAESKLLEALSESESVGENDNANSLINLVACYSHMGEGKKDKLGEYLMRLKEEYKEHDFVVRLGVVEGAFDRVSVKFGQ